jgi:hypothetical protein
LTSLSIEDLVRVKVFSASRHLEEVRGAPAAVTVVTAEEIATFGWPTLGEVLNSARGFYTAYDRNYTYLGVHGLLRPGDYNSRVLFVINGHRINDNIYDSASIGTEFPWEFSASCYNLFGRRWYSPPAPEHLQNGIEQDGRAFRVKVIYRFSTAPESQP